MDLAVASAIGLDASTCRVASHGGSGFSTTSKISATLPDGTERLFFMKTGRGKDAEIMFRGEHASLNAIHDAVPSLCPASFGYGELKGAPGKYFLVTDFLELGGRATTTSKGSGSGMTLMQKLGKLHTTPAPVPEGRDKPMFGFPVTTCCGNTQQPNDYKESWADFYAENRLRAIWSRVEEHNGADREGSALLERVADQVVPRLLGDDHLNGGQSVIPVVVHGDLWSGNASAGRIGGKGEMEEVVFDPSACYAHSEFELGMMKMFGGFSGLKEYHQVCPKTEPVSEYDDRVKLYELYHHLNHYVIFGSGYRSGAMSIMQDLVKKYAGVQM